MTALYRGEIWLIFVDRFQAVSHTAAHTHHLLPSEKKLESQDDGTCDVTT
jgi:hypothetical protein